MSWITENIDVSSASSVHLLLISFDKSLMYIKYNKGAKMNPCGTPAQMSA